MAHPLSLAQSMNIVDATAGCVTTNGGVTSDYVSLKNVQKAFIILQLTQAVGHATVIAIRQALTVAGGSVKAIVGTPEWWENEDTAASDALVKQTAAVSLTMAADIKKKLVICEIDPALLDLANSFDCLNFTVSDSSEATNFVSATFVLLNRYQQSTPPVAITD